MMKTSALHIAAATLCIFAFSTLTYADSPDRIGGAQQYPGYSAGMQNKIKETRAQFEKDQATVNKNLKTFDTLDFVVFSNQEWVRLHESHSKDVIVNWPDGHHTNGIERHIEDLKALFVYAPDTRIEVHPIRFGAAKKMSSSSITPDKKIKVEPLDSNEGYTCVTGVMIGTFTKPMPIGGGKFIQPTNKSFSVPMCTVGHWKNGVMIEEWLYWDNATYMRQIGLGQ